MTTCSQARSGTNSPTPAAKPISSPVRTDRPRVASISNAADGTATGHHAKGSNAASRPRPATSPASTTVQREFSRLVVNENRPGELAGGSAAAVTAASTSGAVRAASVSGAVGAASVRGTVVIRLATLLAAPRAHLPSYADPRPSGTVHRLPLGALAGGLTGSRISGSRLGRMRVRPGAPRTDPAPAGCEHVTVVYWAPGLPGVAPPTGRSGVLHLPDTPGPGTLAAGAVPARAADDPG